MKKMILMALAVAAILPSCTRDDEPEPTPAAGRIDIVIPTDSMENHATITFGCSTTTIQQMTRAALENLSLTDLWLYDLPSGQSSPTLLVHQTSEDADFGAPTVTAEYGDHTFYFVASRGDTPTISGTTISWAKPSDTFWASLSLTIAPSTSASQSVTLQRVAARLRITITDEIPSGLATLSVTPSHWYYGLDILTGEAADDRTTARTVSVPSSYIGTTGQLAASFYCLSPSAAWTTDISLQAMKSDNTPMVSISVADVPMQRNHITAYSGTLFGAGRAISVGANDAWGEDITGSW
jgi:hypothetical protein